MGAPKTLGNDLFIVRFLFANNTEAEILQSSHYMNEFYNIPFIIKSLEIAIAKIFVTTPGFTMYYYENSRFLSIPFITRIEDHLPYKFTNEMRRLTFFSIRMESFLIFKYSSLPTFKEDMTFFVTLGEEDTA